MNINEFSDDIRQVMEVHRNQPETVATQGVANNVAAFDLAAEIRKETERAYPVRDAALTKRLDLLQADLTQAMMDFGISPVVDRIVAARNDALGKGAKW